MTTTVEPKNIKFSTLFFTPYAWSKLLFLRDIESCEVGGFGITPTHLNLIEDIVLVKQQVSDAYVEFDDEGLADFTERMSVERGLDPVRFGRIWIHTHPGNSPSPSSTDEETFAKYLPSRPFSIMYILAKGGDEYCRMKMSALYSAAGDMVSMERVLKTDLAYNVDYPATNKKAWEEEYRAMASKRVCTTITGRNSYALGGFDYDDYKTVIPTTGKKLYWWVDKESVEIDHDQIENFESIWQGKYDYVATMKDGKQVFFDYWKVADGAPSTSCYKCMEIVDAVVPAKAKKKDDKKKDDANSAVSQDVTDAATQYLAGIPDEELESILNNAAEMDDVDTYNLAESEFLRRSEQNKLFI